MAIDMRTKEEQASRPRAPTVAPLAEENIRDPSAVRLVERKESRTSYLTRKDVAGTAVAALVVLVYVANVQDWWYLGSNRWAAITMVAVGAAGCPLGARLVGEKATSLPIMLLGLLGLAALVLAVVAIVTAAQWALLAFTVSIIALWVGTTLRHAATPPPRLAVQ